jgi:hypothetical protein
MTCSPRTACLRHPAVALDDCLVQQIPESSTAVYYDHDEPRFGSISTSQIWHPFENSSVEIKFATLSSPPDILGMAVARTGYKIGNRNHAVSSTTRNNSSKSMSPTLSRTIAPRRPFSMPDRRQRGCAAGHHDRTRCNARRTRRDFVAVALNEADGLPIDAELLCH